MRTNVMYKRDVRTRPLKQKKLTKLQPKMTKIVSGGRALIVNINVFSMYCFTDVAKLFGELKCVVGCTELEEELLSCDSS